MSLMKNIVIGFLVCAHSFAAEEIPLPKSLMPPSITLGQYVDTLCVGEPLQAGDAVWGDMSDSFASWYRLNAGKLKAKSSPMGDLPFFLVTLWPVVESDEQIFRIEYSMPIPKADNSQGEAKFSLYRKVEQSEKNYFEELNKKRESQAEQKERQKIWVVMYQGMKKTQLKKDEPSLIESIRGPSVPYVGPFNQSPFPIFPPYGIHADNSIPTPVSSIQPGKGAIIDGYLGGFRINRGMGYSSSLPGIASPPHYSPVSPSFPMLPRLESLRGLVIRDPKGFVDKMYCAEDKALPLTCCQLDDEGLKAILPYLNSFSSVIEDLRLSYNKLTGRGMEILAPFLSRMINLKELHLGRNNIGDEGLRFLWPCLKSLSKLECLAVSGNNISSQAYKDLLPYLPFKISMLGIGESLDEDAKEAYRAAGFKSIMNTWERRKEDSASSHIDAVGIAYPSHYPLPSRSFPVVPRSESLRGLVIRNPKGFVEKKFCAEDKALVLNYYGLDDEALEAILPHLSLFSSVIEKLELSGNKFTARGMRALEKYLPKMTKLKELRLGNNKIGDEGVRILQSYLEPLRNLELLDVASHNISSQAYKDLLPYLPFKILLPGIGPSLDEDAKEAYCAAGFKPRWNDWGRGK